jgi:hypothetical protein
MKGMNMKTPKPHTGIDVSILKKGHLFLPDSFWIEEWRNGTMLYTAEIPLEETNFIVELCNDYDDVNISTLAAEYLNGKE